MLRYFLNIHFSNAVLVVLVCLGIRLPFFLTHPLPVFHTDTTLFGSWMAGLSQLPFLSFSLSTLAVLLQAFLLNNLCNRHDVIYQHTYLPAYIFILGASIVPEQYFLQPAHLVNILLILALGQIFSFYKSNMAHNEVFSAGFLLGMAALLKTEWLVMFLFLIISIMVFKAIPFRELISALLGFILPLYIAYGMLFVATVSFRNPYLDFIPTSIPKVEIDMFGFLPFIILLIYYIVAQGKAWGNYWKNNIKTRRITQSLLFYTPFALALVLFPGKDLLNDIDLILVPFSVSIAYLYLGKKSKRLKEIANLLILAAIFFVQYYQILHLI